MPDAVVVNVNPADSPALEERESSLASRLTALTARVGIDTGEGCLDEVLHAFADLQDEFAAALSARGIRKEEDCDIEPPENGVVIQWFGGPPPLDRFTCRIKQLIDASRREEGCEALLMSNTEYVQIHEAIEGLEHALDSAASLPGDFR